MQKRKYHKFGIVTAGLMSAAIALQSTAFVPAVNNVYAAESYIYGDLDGNSKLNVFDLDIMKRLYIDSSEITSIQTELCDLDESSAFDTADITMLTDFLLGKIDSFPAGTVYEHEDPTEPPTEPPTEVTTTTTTTTITTTITTTTTIATTEAPTETTTEPYDGLKTLTGNRMMEKLDRGVVAVNTGKSAYVSWRLLASDERDIGFNLYRTTDGKTVKVNEQVLQGGTNYTDTTADLTKANTYSVKTVYNGVEKDTDGSYTLPANKGAGPYVTVPIKDGGTIHFVWVGDFNGDGAYDYLLDRSADDQQKLEAYLNDGTYLWTINLGYNSENKNGIEPGASTIDVGMWDGATVYDIDCDGHAEVMLRIADGVTFGDGSKYTNSDTNAQEIAVIDGMTGALKDSAPVPDDVSEAGPKACMMEIGYLDGVKPSLICWVKNRNDDKSFNSYNVAYTYENGDFVQEWKAGAYGAEAHNIRVIDVDYDGKDEVLHMGYALNSDGSLRYVVPNVVHGDRWYVGSFCNDNNGKEMMGYGIQQDNANGLLEYFYNASTGKLIWEHYAEEGTADVGRGNIGDIDPNYEGLECWSFQGMYSMDNQKISDTTPYPVFRVFWDGDVFSESYNEGKIEKWNYETKGVERLDTTWKIYAASGSERGVGMLHADILGDWREESVLVNYDTDELVIYTTDIETDVRIYSLAQNPAYRNCMTAKGYYQSNVLDYFLGYNMQQPGTPDISYIGEAALEEGTVYAIRNANSGRCMDVYKSSRDDGTNVQQYAKVAEKANNTWTVKKTEDGYYNIISQLSDGTSCYLDIADGKNTNGANVQIWTSNGDDAQKFKLKRNSDGSYLILTKCSGETKCVEVINAETGAGANVQQWVLTGSSCQNWYFEKVS